MDLIHWRESTRGSHAAGDYIEVTIIQMGADV